MKRALLNAALAFAFLAVRPAAAADPGALPVKATPAPAPFDWTGFYVGGNVGATSARTSWTATKAGAAAPSLSGSINMFNSFDADIEIAKSSPGDLLLMKVIAAQCAAIVHTALDRLLPS